jgi:plasmid stabilization system protein ParE
MADYVLSNAADADLDDIYTYSFEIYGESKADAYFIDLRDCLQRLADNRALVVRQRSFGRICSGTNMPIISSSI